MIRHHLRKWIASCTIAAAVGAMAPSSAFSATPQEVQKAIEKAQAYLLAHRNKEGNWEEVQKPQATGKNEGQTDLKSRQWGGLTSIATYALLASGVDNRSEDLRPAITFLEHANITSTYGLGLSSQIVNPDFHIPEKEVSDLIKRNVPYLLAGMHQPSAASINNPAGWSPLAGFYGYWVGSTAQPTAPEFGKQITPATIGKPMPEQWYDRSNSQYGVLGMWALAEAGGEVPTLYWKIEDAAWKKAQLPDGGWNYNSTGEHHEATPSMTAAGIATLFITQDYTMESNWSECKGGEKNAWIERGLHWMDQHIERALDGNTYTMYGIERIGTASGRKYFGTKDWYQIGADVLVKHQAADGSINGGPGGPIPSTAYALVFLARGRAPVLMNKLEYGQVAGLGKKDAGGDNWDERPRDIANLAHWVGHQEEAYLNWQVVNLQVTPEELHDAPILYISGPNALEFNAQEIDKLRKYVEEGGMILGNADCHRDIFSKSFIDLGKKLFPKYEFRQTPPNDFLYTEQFKDFRNKPKVMELNNGVRKLMVLVPDMDPSRGWQTRSSGTQEAAFGLGANIFLYAVDKKNLYAKGDTYIVLPSSAITSTKNIKVARLDLGDNADPEPGGWPRLAAIFHNTFKTDLKVDLIKPEALADYKVATLTGTNKLALSQPSRDAIKKFVEGGGTLIVDAAGGDAAFADTAEAELSQIFSDKKIDLLPSNHLVYNEPGATMEKVGWRNFAIDKVADKHKPKLRGIEFGNRIGVFFSREDLSAGLVGEPVDGIYGYDAATATTLMSGMLLYAESGGAAPAAPPANPKTAQARR